MSDKTKFAIILVVGLAAILGIQALDYLPKTVLFPIELVKLFLGIMAVLLFAAFLRSRKMQPTAKK